MSAKNRNFTWWPLFAVLPLMAGLLLLDSRLSMPTWGHEIVQACIVLIVFALVAAWIGAREPALMWQEAWHADSKTARIVYGPEAQPADENLPAAGRSADGAGAPQSDHAGIWVIRHL